MARLGAFDATLEPKAWFDAKVLPEGWFTDELIPEPTGGGITGSASITLGALTVAGAGTLGPEPITGTGSITLGALTVAGAGTVAGGAITGTGSITLGALTIAGVGTVAGGPVTGTGSITLGALTVAGIGTLGPEPPAPPVIGGGGPGNARGRQRPVYMVDDKVFDSPAAAARYLASVTVPEAAPEAPRAAFKPRPRLAVQVAGEQVAVAPAVPVTATAEYTRELVQAELIKARRAIQRRQREADDEERAAVFAVVQMLLEDGETVTFH
jgi:hypothetical protein